MAPKKKAGSSSGAGTSAAAAAPPPPAARRTTSAAPSRSSGSPWSRLPEPALGCVKDQLMKRKSYQYDQRDIAHDAAACMLVGNAAFTELGKALYRAISPRLGAPTGKGKGLSEKSSAGEMKDLLKVGRVRV